MKLARRLGVVVVIASLTLGSPTAAPGKPDPPVFGSEVTLVLLPVFVADRDGRAIRGLSAPVRETPLISSRILASR